MKVVLCHWRAIKGAPESAYGNTKRLRLDSLPPHVCWVLRVSIRTDMITDRGGVVATRHMY
jgi:hypothetical protein